jgi:hypothetical protein
MFSVVRNINNLVIIKVAFVIPSRYRVISYYPGGRVDKLPTATSTGISKLGVVIRELSWKGKMELSGKVSKSSRRSLTPSSAKSGMAVSSDDRSIWV